MHDVYSGDVCVGVYVYSSGLCNYVVRTCVVPSFSTSKY